MTYTFPHRAVALFAGAGGSGVAARKLGISEIGIEQDPAAHATRKAAGMHTIRGDVRDYGPAMFPKATLLTGGPPCQTFSMAGGGSGRRALETVQAAMRQMAAGETPDPSGWDDIRTSLVLEPLRWIMEALKLGRPFTHVSLEQVPTVLPVWETMAEVLKTLGYTVVTGVLSAEQYGVPQTRKRAVLMAVLGGQVQLPAPTHSRYYPRDRDKLDPGVLKWVSMAEALGWNEVSGYVESNYSHGGQNGVRGKRDIDTPAATVTSKVDRNKVFLTTNNLRANATVRGVDEPAPTLTGGHDSGNRQWIVAAGQTGEGRPRPDTDPAPTVTGKGTAYLLTDPDHYRNTAAPKGVRLSIQQAALLQTFPPDHPWRGTNAQIYQQIGNAKPPLLAEAVLRALLHL